MCGIVGYVGAAEANGRPLDVVMGGLKRLEYRGYDSAGVALVVPGAERLVVAAGVTMVSETDTEVAAHLLAAEYARCGDLTDAMRAVAARLQGTFTLLAVHADVPDAVVGARHDSPLVVGLGEGENFLGSDVAAFIAYTREAMELGQDQVVTITPTSVSVVDFDGNPTQPRRYTVDWDAAAAEKGGFRSFMDKEIHDQPKAVADTLLGRTGAGGRLILDEIRVDESVLRQVVKIVVVACG